MTDQTIDAPLPARDDPPAAQPAPESAQPEPVGPGPAAATRRPGALWLWLVLLGAAMVLIGAASIASPFVASLAVLAWIGAFFVLAGLLQLFQTFGAAGWRGALWHIGSGGLYLLGGLLIVFEPLAGLVALAWLVIATVGLSGLARIFAALALRPQKGWILVLLAGLAAVAVAGVLGGMMPAASLTLLGVLVGVSFLTEGVATLALGLATRRAA